jgi:hypothetical protein
MSTQEDFEPWQGTIPEFVQRVAATIRRDSGGYLANLLTIWLGFRIFSVELGEDFFDVQVADIDADNFQAALGGAVRSDVRVQPRLVLIRVPLDRAHYRAELVSR